MTRAFPENSSSLLSMLSFFLNNVIFSSVRAGTCAIGIKEFFAGCVFKCKIEDLGDLSLDEYLLVTQCTHKISNEQHTMEIRTEVVRSE